MAGHGPVIAFVGLACLLSWAWVLPLTLSGELVQPGQGWPTHFPALLGPMIAAFVVTGVRYGRRGLRDLLGRILSVRVGWPCWLLAVSPLGALVVGLAVLWVLGQPMPPAQDFGQMSGLPAGWGVVGVASAVLVINGFGEETGWRGFALEHLQARFTPLVAALLVVPPWALWHIPQFFLLQSFRALGPATSVGWLIGLACGSILLAWLYNRSGGSILIVAVWHMTYNIVAGTEAARGFLAAFVSTAVMVAAVSLIFADLWARRRGRTSPVSVNRRTPARRA